MSKKTQIWKVYNKRGREIETVVYPQEKSVNEVKVDLVDKGYPNDIVVFIHEERSTS